MAYSVGATTVINSSRQLQNIASLDSTTTTTIANAVSSSVAPSTTAGAVGTYAQLANVNSVHYDWGDTVAGSNLYPVGFRHSSSTSAGEDGYSSYYFGTTNSPRSGTWRKMGGRYTGAHWNITVWVRIS